MLRQSFGKVNLSHRQRSYAWILTDSGVESGYLIGWCAYFHGYGHLRRICGWPDGFADSGLCISLLTGPFKKILRCYWPTFSTDSQLGAFVSTALWLMSRECLLFRRSNFTSDFNRRCLETFSTLFSLRSRQTIWNLYNVCVPSLRRRSMFHGRVLLTSYWARLTTQAEAWR